jgi:hypothetical protein
MGVLSIVIFTTMSLILGTAFSTAQARDSWSAIVYSMTELAVTFV